MFGSTMLDLAIGLIFVYLLLSLVCSAFKEGIESWLKWRAVNLERGLKELLKDPTGEGLTKQLLDHPLLSCLYQGKYDPSATRGPWKCFFGTRLPSYIPATSFATALLDIVLGPAPAPPPQVASPAANTPAVPPAPPLRDAIATIPNEQVRRALQTFVVAAQGDLDKVRKDLEAWFNSAMDRAAGWYKRWSQAVIFGAAVAISFGVNADTIAMITSLSRDPAVREKLVTSAQQYVKDQKGSEEALKELKSNLNKIEAIGLPIGWNNEDPRTRWSWPNEGAFWLKLLGWLLTAFAISLGAPFWFDMLNKVMNIRASVKPHSSPPQ
jgi:hypothetical protein